MKWLPVTFDGIEMQPWRATQVYPSNRWKQSVGKQLSKGHVLHLSGISDSELYRDAESYASYPIDSSSQTIAASKLAVRKAAATDFGQSQGSASDAEPCKGDLRNPPFSLKGHGPMGGRAARFLRLHRAAGRPLGGSSDSFGGYPIGSSGL